MTNTKPANVKVRRAMLDAGMSQAEFASILGVSEPVLSIRLGIEWSQAEQNSAVAKIKEARR